MSYNLSHLPFIKEETKVKYGNSIEETKVKYGNIIKEIPEEVLREIGEGELVKLKE